MSWLKIDNPEIDGEKLQAEIEAEIARLKKEKKLPETDPRLEEAFSIFRRPGGSDLLANLEKYVPGIDRDLNFKRAFFLAPLLRFFLGFLGRIFRHQYIFNSLALEALRKQEERIKALEERRSPPRETSP